MQETRNDLPSLIPDDILNRLIDIREDAVNKAYQAMQSHTVHTEIERIYLPYVIDNVYEEVITLIRQYRVSMYERHEVVMQYIHAGRQAYYAYEAPTYTLGKRIELANRCIRLGHPAHTVHHALHASHLQALSDIDWKIYKSAHPNIVDQIEAILHYTPTQ